MPAADASRRHLAPARERFQRHPAAGAHRLRRRRRGGGGNFQRELHDGSSRRRLRASRRLAMVLMPRRRRGPRALPPRRPPVPVAVIAHRRRARARDAKRGGGGRVVELPRHASHRVGAHVRRAPLRLSDDKLGVVVRLAVRPEVQTFPSDVVRDRARGRVHRLVPAVRGQDVDVEHEAAESIVQRDVDGGGDAPPPRIRRARVAVAEHHDRVVILQFAHDARRVRVERREHHPSRRVRAAHREDGAEVAAHRLFVRGVRSVKLELGAEPQALRRVVEELFQGRDRTFDVHDPRLRLGGADGAVSDRETAVEDDVRLRDFGIFRRAGALQRLGTVL